MTPASARRHDGQAGFTLLEIMATVGILGLTLPLILHVQEQISQEAYRTSYMMRSLHHAQELLARHTRDIDELDGFEGRIEDDPIFRFEITIEDWDLSTGRAEGEFDEDDPYDPAYDEQNQPPDAGVPPEDIRGNPHKVRRFVIKVFWPGFEEDTPEESVVLEGYLPRMWREDDAGFNGALDR